MLNTSRYWTRHCSHVPSKSFAVPRCGLKQAVTEPDLIAAKRMNYLTSVPTKSSSGLKTRSEFKERFTNATIPWGLPYDKNAIELLLLHPVFDQFIGDIKTIEPEADDKALVRQLAHDMPRIFKSTKERKSVFNAALNKHYGMNFQDPQIRNATGGCISANNHCCAILEVKNEVSSAGFPYLKVASNYVNSTRMNAPKYTNSPLPCLLMVLVGPSVVFAGGAWSTQATVTMLSSMWFDFPLNLDLHRSKAERHMAAFRKAVHKLEFYYENLQTPLPSQTPASRRSSTQHLESTFAQRR